MNFTVLKVARGNQTLVVVASRQSFRLTTSSFLFHSHKYARAWPHPLGGSCDRGTWNDVKVMRPISLRTSSRLKFSTWKIFQRKLLDLRWLSSRSAIMCIRGSRSSCYHPAGMFGEANDLTCLQGRIVSLQLIGKLCLFDHNHCTFILPFHFLFSYIITCTLTWNYTLLLKYTH